ncbi:PTS sugar transporter subunit IIA [Enterococcus olivae]
MSKLAEWLPADHIQVIDSVGNWQEAVQRASEPLLKENKIAEQYVKNMIESVENNGPYMVLSDYFALMHARPGEGVNKQGVSLLVSNQAVDMKGKEVKVFLVLAAEDNQSHLAFLQDIMTVFMDEAQYNMILSGERQEIIELFN